jgi:Delta3-Delta2-enoyl-CoA isomerase
MQAMKLMSFTRHASMRIAPLGVNLRNQSTQLNKLVLVDVNDKTGIALVTLNSPPVNSLNLELLSAFAKSLEELKTNNSRGMILTSVSRK